LQTLSLRWLFLQMQPKGWEMAVLSCVSLLVGTLVALFGSLGLVHAMHGVAKTAPVLKLSR
jgi:hypothetical protein